MTRQAVVIFPTGDLEPIEQFRRRWDPLSSSVSAHITLVFPIENPVPEEVLERQCESLFSGFPAFRVSGRTVQRWEENYLFLLLDQGSEQVRAIHDALYAGPFSGVNHAAAFLPHMTVGRTAASLLDDALHDAERCALALDAQATAITVYRIHENRRREKTLTYPLARAG